jgi:hypothetical protein
MRRVSPWEWSASAATAQVGVKRRAEAIVDALETAASGRPERSRLAARRLLGRTLGAKVERSVGDAAARPSANGGRRGLRRLTRFLSDLVPPVRARFSPSAQPAADAARPTRAKSSRRGVIGREASVTARRPIIDLRASGGLRRPSLRWLQRMRRSWLHPSRESKSSVAPSYSSCCGRRRQRRQRR